MFLYIFAGFLTIASYSCIKMQKADIITHNDKMNMPVALLKLLL